MGNKDNKKEDNKERLIYLVTGIAVLIILALPFVIRHYNLIKRDGWFGFLGSYLGGLFGGIATLVAVLYTIKSNIKVQDRKEKIERQKAIQKSAVIIYYDFQFVIDDIVQFMNIYAIFYLIDHGEKLDHEGKNYLDSKVDVSIYINVLPNFTQFYFDDNWISNVAELKLASLNEHTSINIKRIYEIYGNLLTIKKSLDVNKKDHDNIQNICQNAFDSMNNLVEPKYVNGKGNCGLAYIKEDANGKEETLSVRTKVKDDVQGLLDDLKKLSYYETIDCGN